MQQTLTPEELQASFIKWQAGRLDERETARLETWRAASPEHEAEWQQLLAFWQNATLPRVPTGHALETQWTNLLARIDEAEAPAPTLADSWSTRARGWLAQIAQQIAPRPRWVYAALAAALLFIALRLVDFTRDEAWQVVRAPFGEHVQLVLDDGSRVQLNAGSFLYHPQKFSGKTRRVELNGEAFFEVRSRVTPFEVSTPHAHVRVLGTAFNVRTWERATTVFVQSGKVALRSNQATTEVQLTANEAARCADTVLVLSHLETNDALAWREGKLVFRARPLAQVLEELQRHFNVRIQADAALLAHTVTASFASEPVRAVLEALAAALNARAVHDDEGYWLRAQQTGGRE